MKPCEVQFLVALVFIGCVTPNLSIPETRDTQFLESVESCAGYRGPQAWKSFILKIRGKISKIELAPLVSAQGENVAVLVEPRKDPCIGLIVRAVFYYLNGGADEEAKARAQGWRLHVFHGPDNLDFIKSELQYSPNNTDYAKTCDALQSDKNICESMTGNILDKVTFSDISKVVKIIDTAAVNMEKRIAQLKERQPNVHLHYTYDSRKGASLPESARERWPMFILKKWMENREEMRNEQQKTNFWNLNRIVYSQVCLFSAHGF